MKRALLLIPTLLAAESSIHIQDESVMLQNLITVTEDNLSAQKQLYEFLVKYKELEDLIVSDNDEKANSQRAGQLMLIARQMLSLINEHALHDYFDKNFLDTLAQLTGASRRPRISGV